MSINLYDDLTLRAFLEPAGFADWPAAQRCLKRIAESSAETGRAFDHLLPHLLATLSACADPARALTNFERYSDAFGAPALVSLLADDPRLLEILITLFAGSQFLTEILLRNPADLGVLSQRNRLAERKSAEHFAVEAANAHVGEETSRGKMDALRRYQHGELLRLGASDLLDLYDLTVLTRQLSNLADGMTRTCLDIAASQTGRSSEDFVVLAMGKLGGHELNYSSDIDLLFLSASEAGSYLALGQHLIDLIANVTGEGFLYRVDMRLRPWGKDGLLVSGFDSYLDYLQKHARLWEKQALLKARPIAGNLALGKEFLKRAEPYIFNASPEAVRANTFAMKQRTEQVLRQEGRNWGEVKLGEGSIRDVEFVVQYLQLAYGGARPEIRSRSTLDALPRLTESGLLSASEARTLADGYIFLRTTEHYLQMMHYRQTYTLPAEPTAIALLARRLGFQGEAAGERFLARYQQHGSAIRAIYLRRVGSEKMSDETGNSPQVDLHLKRMDISYAQAFTKEEIQHHAMLAAKLDENNLAIVDAIQLNDEKWRVSIVAYDYPGELSLICGLMFVHGLDINDGDAFTYEPVGETESSSAQIANIRRKIVDVFTVTPVQPEPLPQDVWQRYSDDLLRMVNMMRTGQRREAHGQLARLVGAAFNQVESPNVPLYTIDIEIDNDTSERYTVLRIDAPDTTGFLYELTNALALNRIYIARVAVQSVGNRVHDALYVTDDAGHKITTPEKQRELRAATVLIKHFTHLLPQSPNPEAALLHFREFIAQLFERPNWPDELASIERSNVLSALAKVLGVSDFLWDDFLRMQYTNLFPVVQDVDALSTAKSREQLQYELAYALQSTEMLESSEISWEISKWRDALNAFKDREMFRIDMRHILGHTPEFWDFSAELTDLVELVVKAAFERCYDEMHARYGDPIQENGSICPVTVFALGKCGGRELGFASDIELMFVYGEKGETSGPKVLSTGEFFEKLVSSFVTTIQARQEGIFQVDLQLRPYGKTGNMSVALDSFRRYYAPSGPAWPYERQALVKLRPIAGDETLAAQTCALRDEYVYAEGVFDVTAMRAMRERQVRHLVTGGTFNAKYSPGGLVDVEYLVQGLQIMHGAANPALRGTNIREAMAALNQAGILSEEDYTHLRKVHTFLRWMIDSLRVVRGNAHDVTIPPYGSEEFAFLARRLLYGNNTAALNEDLNRFAADVQEMNKRLLK